MTNRELIERSYAAVCGREDSTRLEWVAEYVFGFCTYDGEISEEMARDAIEICAVVSCGKTFDYIEDPANYRKYILYCNLPFFDGKLEWGTSIRGAWWDTEGIKLGRYVLVDESGEWVEYALFTVNEWCSFLNELAAWAYEVVQ